MIKSTTIVETTKNVVKVKAVKKRGNHEVKVDKDNTKHKVVKPTMQ
jgi:hypothetical protein